MKIKCWICEKMNRYTNPDMIFARAGLYKFKCKGCRSEFVIEFHTIFQEFTSEEMRKIQDQIKNKTFAGKLVCGSCEKDINPYEDDFEFCGKPMIFGFGLPEAEEKRQAAGEETYNPVCRECHNNMWDMWGKDPEFK